MSMDNAGSRAPVVRLASVSLRYGKTLALDRIDLDIPAARMVGLLGPDGVGKSSLMSLAAGARAVQEGRVEALGGDMSSVRHRNTVCPHIAYMPQGLGKNLYPTLSIEENLQFFGRLFGHDAAERRRRIDQLTAATGLQAFLNRPAGKLSGGMKQKLGLCCALIHDPDLLILDEPTTGVDPLARRQFWELISGIRQRRPEMSVIVATAYMEEADAFDWLVAMDAGRVLATGTPRELRERTGRNSLEAAFIALLPEEKKRGHRAVVVPPLAVDNKGAIAIEARELTMRFGDFTAVDHVSFRIRRGEIFGFLGSNGCGKSTTMKMLTGLLPASAGQAWLFGQQVDAHDIATRRRVGYMSQAFSLYSELTVQQNLVLHARLFSVPEAEIPSRVRDRVSRFGLEGVFDALPDSLPLGVRQRLSLAVAMVHEPAMLTALSVVREKELGSIINLYVTPVTRMEFLLGKQLPYIVLGMLNFLLMTLLAVTVFGVPVKGSFATLALAALIFIVFSTGLGLFASTFTRSQIAALFLTLIGTMLPAIEFAGLLNPVSSLEGAGKMIGQIYPATYMLTISRGVFAKALDLSDLHASFVPMLLAVPVILGLSIALLQKQDT